MYAPTFGRSARAIDDVSLRVAAGEIAAVSGPAGAGKSTLLALVLGFEQPTGGTVRVDGVEPRRFVEREGIAYLPQPLTLPGWWRVVGALTRLAMLSGVRAAQSRSRVEAVLRDLGLDDVRRTRLRRLNRDARVRFGLAQAILADRRVIVFDEPLEGLGAESLARFRDLLVRLRAFDRAILIASRDTAELQRIADRVTMIDRGRVRRVGASRPVTPVDAETVFHLVVPQGGEHVLAVFPTAISLGKGTFAVRVSGLAALNRGLRDLLERGALIGSVAPAHAAEPNAFPLLADVVS
jgi:ABC-type multidrug transport system ATPase subunit